MAEVLQAFASLLDHGLGDGHFTVVIINDCGAIKGAFRVWLLQVHGESPSA